jgi:dihydroxyacid dehydratase/phosphogluconate dehydratase
VGLITDGRFSGGTWGMVVGHVAPEAASRRLIALVQEGDSITIDAHQLLLQLNVDDAELARRRAAWKAPAPRYTRGVLAKFAFNAAAPARARCWTFDFHRAHAVARHVQHVVDAAGDAEVAPVSALRTAPSPAR